MNIIDTLAKPRVLGVLLAVSVALNLLLIGSVAGRYSARLMHPPMMGGGFEAGLRFLPEGQRKELRRTRTNVDPLEESLADPAPTPPELLERRQRGLGVQQALAQLPQRQRSAIVLSHYEERSQAEAAAILDISEGALESLLSRARATLRTLLRDQRH